MKLRLLSIFAVLAVAACATSTNTKIGDPIPGDGTTPDGTTPPGQEEESDDPADQPPHSLGVITLGESHGSGGSTKSTPIVSATFWPDAMLTRSCKTKLEAGCEIQEAVKCTKVSTTTTGCNSNEVCTLDNATCKAVCKPYAVCEEACDVGEVCKQVGTGSDTTGTCVKSESFDAGPLAFSGTTTSITMFPPYKFESEGQGAPFLGGAELHVQASGATEAGFEKFDEKFTATTFLQTTPSLSKIPRDKVFGSGALPIAWAPGNDTILISISGAGGTVTCKAKDSAGKFEVPRSVVEAAQGDGETTTTTTTSLNISVARQRREVKKDKHAKGELALASVKPDGWLQLVTLSAESASFQGCPTGQTICSETGSTCTDLSYDRNNCGSCDNVCPSSQSCVSGKCTGGSSSGSTGSCTSCRSSAESGACYSSYSTCNADTQCYYLASCAASCTTASCLSSCESSYPSGVAKWSPLKSCLSSSCYSSCGF